ncbi:MAG: SufD family Fe-S cluster assembly protein [Clostridia bacterium]|nr:SufD family Fe-S cluster assembly protein [Clostridia bacterium]
MDKIDKELLLQIADLHSIPEGAYNIRKNGKLLSKNTNADIDIVPKKNKSGIDIIIKPNVKNKSCHIPVILSESGITDVVYNDFYIGDNADVVIIAGCGISCSSGKSEHDGIHSFHLGKNSRVKYVEKHLGIGKEEAERVLNPITKIYMKENSYFEMDSLQLGGVTYTDRKTYAKLKENAKLVIKEKILTTSSQVALTKFRVELNGKGSSVDVISRSVAKDFSKQTFYSNVIGNEEVFGHVECDGILCDNAKIISTPKIEANNVNASLVHEAAIGKIAGEQLIKLMSLGLTREEAENVIIKGFLN